LASLLADQCDGVTVAVPPRRTDLPLPSSGGGAVALPDGVHRLAGADRFETAIRISERFSPGVPVVYIATGLNYPDALSASALAGAQGGPLLLVQPTTVP